MSRPAAPQDSPPTRTLTATQDAHFAERASSWTARYQSSPSFRARLKLVGKVIDNILRDRPGVRVLDFGGGTGVFSVLASRWTSSTVSIDRSLPMLSEGSTDSLQIEAMLRSEGFEGPFGTTARIAGDTQCIDSLRTRFDLVMAIAVLEYVNDVPAVMTQLTQLVDNGGILLITVPNRTSPLRVAQRILRPILTRKQTTPGRLADQAYVGIRPHGDAVHWRSSANTAGLVVNRIEALPLGLSGARRWLHPTLLISLRRPEGTDA
ncbi:MAG: class I SAM-dependent methyltransferase [Acidimicrobiales bacterium]